MISTARDEGDEVPSPARFVIDASVAIKWFVPEIYATEAALYLDPTYELHVPDLLYIEVGNILWKKVRRGELSGDEAREIVRRLSLVPLVVHLGWPLLGAAIEIALRTGRTVYDSLYLALAVQAKARLVTADEKLSNSLSGNTLSNYIRFIK